MRTFGWREFGSKWGGGLGAVVSGTAPTITSSDVWPEPGSVMTITAGTSDATVTLDGVEVAAVAAGGSLEYTATDAGDLVVSSDDGSASVVIRPAKTEAQFFLFPEADHAGDASAVTSITDAGAFGLIWASVTSGNGTPIQKVAGGWRFSAGNYARITSGFPPGNYDRAVLVVKATAFSAPSGTTTIYQLDGSTGSRTSILQWLPSTNAANEQYLIPTSQRLGAALVVGVEWDYNGGASRVRNIGMDGYKGGWRSASSSLEMALDQLRIGQNFDGILHEAMAVLRPTGGEWPLDPATIWGRVAGLRVEDQDALDAGPVEIMDSGGQSLFLGASTASAEAQANLNLLDRAGVKIPDGLRQADGQVGTLNTTQGPGNVDIDPAVPATGLIPGNVYSFGPVAHYLAVALRRRRAALSLPNPQIVSMFHGISGQSVYEFDDDDPAVTGVLGTRIKDNREIMDAQAWAATAGRQRSFPWIGFGQGEADANKAAGEYYTAMLEVWQQWRDYVAGLTGTPPTPYTTQIGTFADEAAAYTYNVRREQIEACIDAGGVFAAPWYAVPVADNRIHPNVDGTMLMADTIAWMMVELEQGNAWPLLTPTATRDGADLVLTYPEPVALHDAAKYTPYGGVTDAGFHDAGSISSVSASGNTIRLTTDATSWRYAEQTGDMSAYESAGLNYGPSRGLVRSTRSTPSVMVDGATLYRWAPAWSGAV